MYILDINYISLNSVAHPKYAIANRMPYEVRIHTYSYAYDTHIPRTPPTHARTHVLYLRICTLERINARLQALEARGGYGRVIQRSIGLEERLLKGQGRQAVKGSGGLVVKVTRPTCDPFKNGKAF